jgi:beta-lactamase regulating signal transducer with metallopeptidase domain
MLWWLAQNTVTAAVLATAVALLCRLGRFGPAMRHALWLVVLLKLLSPPLIAWPWQLPDVGRFFPPGSVSILEPPAGEDPPVVSDDTSETIVALAFLRPGGSDKMPFFMDTPSEQAAAARPVKTSIWPAWLPSVTLDVWLAGTAAMCLLQLARIVRFGRLLGAGQPAPRWLAKQVDKLADSLRVKRPATLVVPGIGSPFVWHMGRAKLLWPASLTERQPLDRRRSVIVHELAHLRRRDQWVGWLQMVAECLWWWNPLFWYVRRQLRFYAELACDAWVVSTLPEGRRAYAEALIEVTQLVSQRAAPLPALGMSGGARHEFERRLTMIMRDRVPCKVSGLGLVAIGCLALAALPGWSQSDAQKKEEAKKVDELTIVAEPYLTLVNEVLAVADNEVTLLAADEKPAPDSDREKKLKEVEQKLQALLKEVQALRGGGSTPNAGLGLKLAKPERQPKANKPKSPTAGQTVDAVRKQYLVQDLVVKLESIHDGQGAGTLIVLSRATYKLPKGKAEALAKFLQDHAKVPVMETKVDGDSLIITTTPEAQKTIGQFVRLIRGLAVTRLDPNTGKQLESNPNVFWEAVQVPAESATLRLFLNEALQKAEPDKPKEDKPRK